MDLSKFKKVKSDKDTTTLAHPDGHSIVVAHRALSPKMRSQMASLPTMSDGGEVQEDETLGKRINYPGADKDTHKPKPSPTPYYQGGMAKDDVPEINKEKAAEFVKGFTGAKEKTKAYHADAPEDKHAAPGEREVQEPKRVPASEPEESKAPNETYPATESKGGKIKRMADGGVASSTQDSPEQITQDAQSPQQAPVIVNVHNSPQPQDNFERGPGGANFSFDKYALNNPNTAPIESQTAALQKIDSKQQEALAAQAQAATNEKNQIDQYNAVAARQGLPEKAYPPALTNSLPNPGDQSAAMPKPQQAAPQTPSQEPQDTFGTQAYTDAYTKGLNEQKQGLINEATATGNMGKQQAQQLQDNLATQQEQQKSFEDHFNQLDSERQNWVKDLQDQHIDAQHYMNSMSTGKRILSSIGLILGGFGAGAGQENGAQRIIQDNINRDIDAQKANLGKTENLLSANLKQFGNLRDATDMTRVMQMDVVANQLKMAAAQTTDPLAKARALQHVGELDAQAAPILSQMAMRKSLLSSTRSPSGQWDPVRASRVINMIMPENQRAAANKELQDAQNAVRLRDDTLRAFDQVVKMNTIGNRMANPIQSTRQLDAIKGTALDKLTKDTSGRVTPETVKLVGGIFSKLGNDAKTNMIARSRLQDMLSTNMHYPLLDQYPGLSPVNANQRSIPEAAPVAPRK